MTLMIIPRKCFLNPANIAIYDSEKVLLWFWCFPGQHRNIVGILVVYTIPRLEYTKPI